MKNSLLILLFLLFSLNLKKRKNRVNILKLINGNSKLKKLSHKLLSTKNFKSKLKIYNQIKSFIIKNKLHLKKKGLKHKKRRRLDKSNYEVIHFIKSNREKFISMPFSEFKRSRFKLEKNYHIKGLPRILNNYEYLNLKNHENIANEQKIEIRFNRKLVNKRNNINYLINTDQKKFDIWKDKITKRFLTQKLITDINKNLKFISYVPKHVLEYLNKINKERKEKRKQVEILEDSIENK